MGMFDYFVINSKLLPVIEEEKEKLKDVEWQTKSFDRGLYIMEVKDDMFLYKHNFDYQNVPKAERPYPNDDGIKGSYGSLRRVNEREERQYCTTEAYFYGSTKSNERDWYEFKGKFVNGELVELKHIEARW